MPNDEVYRAVIGLRALRAYRPEPIAEDDLDAVLEAARWTGSSKNRQRWAFVVVVDPEQRQRLAECGDFTDPVRNAPVTIALVQEPDGYEFDIGRVAQTIMLAAATRGVASCPITLHRDTDAAQVLGLPPGARSRYAVALGYPGEEAEPARLGGRRSKGDLVHVDRWNSGD